MHQHITGVFSLPVATKSDLDRIMALGDIENRAAAVEFCIALGGQIMAFDLRGVGIEIQRKGAPVVVLDAASRLTPQAKTRWLCCPRFDVQLTFGSKAWQTLQHFAPMTGYDPPDSLDSESVAITACIDAMKTILEAIKYPGARLVWTKSNGQQREWEPSLFSCVREKYAEMEKNLPSATIHLLRPGKHPRFS